MNNDKWAIGIDLGGTKIEAAHIDERGNIQNRIRIKTDVDDGPEAVQEQIIRLVNRLKNEAEHDKPVGVGIGVAGQVDEEMGLVKYAPNLRWDHVSLGSKLQEQIQIPVTVLNDVRAATWGEWLFGAGKDCDDLICIFIGTGIGGGIVSGGKMLAGASNTAGEIGHMTVALDGPDCHCGNKGCLEALAGSWAIERDAQKAVRKHGKSGSGILELAGSEVQNIKAKTVIKAFKNDDKLATKLINNVVNALGGGLTGLTNILNPERIIMGGGVTEHMPDLIGRVEKKVQKRALKAATEVLEFVPTQLHDDSGVIGAAACMFRKEDEEG